MFAILSSNELLEVGSAPTFFKHCTSKAVIVGSSSVIQSAVEEELTEWYRYSRKW